MAASRSQQRSMYSYDGSVKLVSDLLNIGATVVRRTQPGRKCATEITIQTSEKLTLKNEITYVNTKDFTHTFSIQHPRYTRVSYSHIGKTSCLQTSLDL